MKVLGCIIAGGKSSRMGQNKALLQWRGRSLMAHVVERLAPQVNALVINGDEIYRSFGFSVIPDRTAVGTPLAGLAAALAYAADHGFDAVLSAPCDCPLLPENLRVRLQGADAAIAASAGQAHYLTGFWPIACLPLFVGLRRVQDFAAAAQAREVEWEFTGLDPFININTHEDFSLLG